jgi:hypothetical protein
MIAAQLENGVVVKILDLEESDIAANSIPVRALDRENIGQTYVGGQGYTGSKFLFVQAEQLKTVALIPDACIELATWLDAMDTVDRLADNHSPDTSGAIELEERAREAFVVFLHKESLARKEAARHESPVFTSNLPLSSPQPPAEQYLLEVPNANLYASSLATNR